MHSLMTYAGASWRIRIANVFLIAGKLLHVIGMFTPFWLTTGNNHQGLWQMCLDMIIATKCFSMMSIDLEAWFRAVQAMSCLGLIASTAAVTTAVMYTRRTDNTKLTLAGVSSCIAGTLVLIGVTIYGVKIHVLSMYLSWSFALETSGGILLGIAGALFLLELNANNGLLPK